MGLKNASWGMYVQNGARRTETTRNPQHTFLPALMYACHWKLSLSRRRAS